MRKLLLAGVLLLGMTSCFNEGTTTSEGTHVPIGLNTRSAMQINLLEKILIEEEKQTLILERIEELKKTQD